MGRKFPPLKSIVAFEAAARHLSVTRAAEELFVVPAAVSHHIRSLEDWLGVPLFRQQNRVLELTEAGQAYAKELGVFLDGLDNATDAVKSCSCKDNLTVTLPPSFTTKWFLPRFQRFREQYPDIDLDLTVSGNLTDCTHESTDVAVHYSRGDYPDMYAVKLNEIEVFPVCSPKILYGLEPPKTYVDLEKHTLLHDDMLKMKERVNWRFWLQSAGVTSLDFADRGLHFNQASVAYQAAIDGHGIVLAKNTLVSLDLHQGSLIRLFSHSCRPGFFHNLICRPSKKDDPRIIMFKQWLLSEMEYDTKLGNAITPISQP